MNLFVLIIFLWDDKLNVYWMINIEDYCLFLKIILCFPSSIYKPNVLLISVKWYMLMIWFSKCLVVGVVLGYTEFSLNRFCNYRKKIHHVFMSMLMLARIDFEYRDLVWFYIFTFSYGYLRCISICYNIKIIAKLWNN